MSEIAERLERNLETIARDEPALIRRVYEDLFSHHPSIAELFTTHRTAVRAEMLREILVIALAQAEGASWVEENLASLGYKHHVNEVTHEMYGWFTDCLIRIFAEFSGSEWCAELEADWRAVLEQLSDQMRRAGEDAGGGIVGA